MLLKRGRIIVEHIPEGSLIYLLFFVCTARLWLFTSNVSCIHMHSKNVGWNEITFNFSSEVRKWTVICRRQLFTSILPQGDSEVMHRWDSPVLFLALYNASSLFIQVLYLWNFVIILQHAFNLYKLKLFLLLNLFEHIVVSILQRAGVNHATCGRNS